jgi:hypothetical protein
MSHFSLGYDALFSKDRDLQPHKAHVLLGAEDVSVSRRARHYFPLNGYLNRIAVIGPARSYDPFQRDIENASHTVRRFFGKPYPIPPTVAGIL